MATTTSVSPSTTAQHQTRGSAGYWVRFPFTEFSTMPSWRRTAGDQCRSPNQTSPGTGLAGTCRRTMLRPGCLRPVLLPLHPPCLCDHKTELPPTCGGLASPSPRANREEKQKLSGEFFLGSVPTPRTRFDLRQIFPSWTRSPTHPHCTHPRTHCYPTAG